MAQMAAYGAIAIYGAIWRVRFILAPDGDCAIFLWRHMANGDCAIWRENGAISAPYGACSYLTLLPTIV